MAVAFAGDADGCCAIIDLDTTPLVVDNVQVPQLPWYRTDRVALRAEDLANDAGISGKSFDPLRS